LAKSVTKPAEHAFNRSRKKRGPINATFGAYGGSPQKGGRHLGNKITGCEFQVPQNLRKLSNVYANNCMP